jgi:hypothetical protein
VRLILNIVLKSGLFLFFNWLGWLTVKYDGRPTTDAKNLITAAIIAGIIFWVASLLAKIIGVVIVMATGGLAILLYPLLGWLTLHVMHGIAPDFIGLSTSFWLVAIAGFVIGSVHLPSPKTAAPAQPADRPPDRILLRSGLFYSADPTPYLFRVNQTRAPSFGALKFETDQRPESAAHYKSFRPNDHLIAQSLQPAGDAFTRAAGP